MSIHTAISPEEAADRLAIRELIDAYGTFADRRLPEQQADLYIPAGRTLVFQGSSSVPDAVLTTRDQHIEGFSTLSQYSVTTHFNGQFTIELDGADQATGKGNCLAHHLLETEDGRSLILMSIRYEDRYAKRNGEWLFAERRLLIDWTDTRPSRP
ncbi:nuclear transport factor 2 family protein [Glaciihabitans sp. dw_435]|uniref:nuclear transport factor 2 family protein n=1 Tax=Glaciihabitans sp. dw_435 TaxID=2720081 RepID=UPI001BD52192|nr:nuclear transport factor 2 family protein [Glaciihabitans sp. dw_435]